MEPTFSREIRDDGLEDPMIFVLDYSERNGLPEECGQSLIERECVKRAEAAREEYKARRHAADIEAGYIPVNYKGGASAPNTKSNASGSLSGISKPEERKFSSSQKYNIRLRNNRKSAHASKVYAEVLKRELSKVLADLSNSLCRRCRQPMDGGNDDSSESNSREGSGHGVTRRQKAVDPLANRLEKASTTLLNSKITGMAPNGGKAKDGDQPAVSKNVSTIYPEPKNNLRGLRGNEIQQDGLIPRMSPLHTSSPITASTPCGYEAERSPWQSTSPIIQIHDIPVPGTNVGTSLPAMTGSVRLPPEGIGSPLPIEYSSSPVQAAVGESYRKMDVRGNLQRPFPVGTLPRYEYSRDTGPAYRRKTGNTAIGIGRNRLEGNFDPSSGSEGRQNY